ncbi:hypothetical protein [Lysobacter capsici]|uniref:hypothetical protein n=1 Tax=Lysobacter capsici TaxID=435897 RepID=UPI0009E3D448|nr:hypothetical protein [Lysobacter capsici]
MTLKSLDPRLRGDDGEKQSISMASGGVLDGSLGADQAARQAQAQRDRIASSAVDDRNAYAHFIRDLQTSTRAP